MENETERYYFTDTKGNPLYSYFTFHYFIDNCKTNKAIQDIISVGERYKQKLKQQQSKAPLINKGVDYGRLK